MPSASGRPAPAQPAAGACTKAWRRRRTFPRAQSAPPAARPGRAAGCRWSGARTRRRSVAICSLRLRPLCSLYPVSPMTAKQLASRRNDARPRLPRPGGSSGFSACCPICSRPRRIASSSDCDSTPAAASARAWARLADSSSSIRRWSKGNDRCQRSNSGSSGWRNLPAHIFTSQPPSWRVHASARAAPGCG